MHWYLRCQGCWGGVEPPGLAFRLAELARGVVRRVVLYAAVVGLSQLCGACPRTR